MAYISLVVEQKINNGVTILIDGNSVVYRAFFKAPPLKAGGMPTGVIHVFLSILDKLENMPNVNKIIVIFDAKGKNKRHEMFEAYKATREAIPEDLSIQIEALKSIVPNMGIETLCISGYEADDVIYTMAQKSSSEVYIVTKDKDLHQLVSDKIKIYDYQAGEVIDREKVFAKFEVYPEQIQDMLSLMGDSSDNIPGVKGVGEKTAVALIKEYGSLDGIYAHLDEIKGKVKEKLEVGKADAYMSKELVKLQHVPEIIETEPKRDTRILKDIYERYGLKTHLKKLLAGNIEEKIETQPQTQNVYDILSAGSDVVSEGDIEKAKYVIYSDGEIYSSDGKSYRTYINNDEDSAEYFYDIKQLIKRGVNIKSDALDLMLISWLIDPDSGGVRRTKTEREEDFISKVSSGAELSVTKLENLNLSKLYYNIELPVARILANAEAEGIILDSAIVNEVASHLKSEISKVLIRMMDRAGESINPNSPKQLGEYLYGTLGLKPSKKNKRGFSTDEEALIDLRLMYTDKSDIIDDILKYRELNKFLSTYTLNLLEFISSDGRIHTDFKQTGTATGRLSSANPNLQNIPQRTSVSERLRSAFKAKEGYSFVSFDYSQIELRVLAHVAEDSNLIKSFVDDIDIHTMTAMNVFHLQNEDEVTNDLRRISKAVNFGVLYGLSAYGLARDVRIPASEAKTFIERYFSLYPNVKTYLENVVAEAGRNGYTETVLGRKRFIADINSRNGLVRSRSERMAANAAIQGSAADIIKLAMIDCDKYISNEKIDAKLILQIHDELIFEVRDNIVDKFAICVKDIMEAVIKLKVPLKVNFCSGKDWGAL